MNPVTTRAPSYAPPASRPEGADPFAAMIAWEPEDATLGELYVAAMALRDHAEDAAQ